MNKTFDQALEKIDEETLESRFPNIKSIEIPKLVKKTCPHHSFCNDTYEFNDQTKILKQISQPVSNYNGDLLPIPPSRQMDSRARQRNGLCKYQEITEEALDDWIAQSSNRPIISYLDPYKKFHAPDHLLNKIKQRYRKLISIKDVQLDEKKRLYFEEPKHGKKVPHYMVPTRQPKEMQKDLTFRFEQLQPKKIKGTSIQLREENVWNCLKQRINSKEKLQLLQDFGGGGDQFQQQQQYEGEEEQQQGQGQFITISNNNNGAFNDIEGDYQDQQSLNRILLKKNNNNFNKENNNFNSGNLKQKIYQKKRQTQSVDVEGYDDVRNKNNNNYSQMEQWQQMKQRIQLKDQIKKTEMEQYVNSQKPNINDETNINDYQLLKKSLKFVNKTNNNKSVLENIENFYNQDDFAFQNNSSVNSPSLHKHSKNSLHKTPSPPSKMNSHFQSVQSNAGKNKHNSQDNRNNSNQKQQLSNRNQRSNLNNTLNNNQINHNNSITNIQDNSIDSLDNNNTTLNNNNVQPGQQNHFSLQSIQKTYNYQGLAPNDGNNNQSNINSHQIQQQYTNQIFPNNFETLDPELQNDILQSVQHLLQHSNNNRSSIMIQRISNNQPQLLLQQLISQKQQQQQQQQPQQQQLLLQQPQQQQLLAKKLPNNNNYNLQALPHLPPPTSLSALYIQQQFQNLNMHIMPLVSFPKHKKKSELTSLEFQIWKTVRRLKKEAWEQAAECCRKGLQYEPNDFTCIFNFGAILERLKMFESAKKWFMVALKFDNEMKAQAHWGIALCCYKMGLVEEALEHVEAVILDMKVLLCSGVGGREGTGMVNKDNKEVFYLRALCLKLLGRKEQAFEQFLQVEKFICQKNYFPLMHFMFTIAYKKLRGQEVQYSIKTYTDLVQLVHQVAEQGEYQSLIKPLEGNNAQIVQKLKSLPFFKRFSDTELMQYLIPFMKVEHIDKHKIANLSLFNNNNSPNTSSNKTLLNSNIGNMSSNLTIKSKPSKLSKQPQQPQQKEEEQQQQQVIIITSGTIAVTNHAKQFDRPDIVINLSKGDIIGCNDKDNGIFTHPDIWMINYSELEYIALPQQHFLDLWRLQAERSRHQPTIKQGENQNQKQQQKVSFQDQSILQTNQNEQKQSQRNSLEILEIVQQMEVMRGVSELCQYKLSFELLEVVKFVKNDCIYNSGEVMDPPVKYITLKKIENVKESRKNYGQNTSNGGNNPSQPQQISKAMRNEFSKQMIKGFYIVKSGICELQAPFHAIEQTLGVGDLIGENLLFDSHSVTRFGRILAKTEHVECFFLQKANFDKINTFDIEIIRQNYVKSAKYQKVLSLIEKCNTESKVNVSK